MIVQLPDLAAMRAAFDAQHEKLYGHADASAPVQVVTLRLMIAGTTPKPALPRLAAASGPALPAARVDSFLDGAWTTVPLYQREALRAGHGFASPAIIAQPDCTTCIPAGFALAVDGHGNLLITPAAR